MGPLIRTTPAFWLLSITVVCALLLWQALPQRLAVKPPAKPDGVPVHAVWKGGPDGGWFFACDLSKVLTCTIYNDHSGTVEKTGSVQLADWQKVKYRTTADVYKDLDFFDGESLHFSATASGALK
jgi:hypothetical protein